MVEVKFSNRCNSDGTWESIFPECYRVVAENREEAELKRAEGRHVCLSLYGRMVRIDWAFSLIRRMSEKVELGPRPTRSARC
jgi:hypothetical protein